MYNKSEVEELMDNAEDLFRTMLDSSVFPKVAACYANLVFHLEDAGFSREEAMRLVTAQGLGVTVK